MRYLIAPLGALGLIASAASVAAFSIGMDAFDGTIELDTYVNTYSGTAQSPGICQYSDDPDCDLEGNFQSSTQRLVVNWVDDDSFDVFFALDLPSGTPASPPPTRFSLTGLDFTDTSGAAADIGGFAFNLLESEIATDGYLADPDSNPDGADFVDPDVSYTPTSVSASFSFFDPQLYGDQAFMRFDVSGVEDPGPGPGPTPPTPAPIPLPAGFWLLIGALAGLTALRKRATA